MASATLVILNWNGLDLLKNCIESIKIQSYSDYEIVVVDNGSTDGSVEWLSVRSDITPIYNKKNLGFAPAINQGFAYAIKSGSEFVVSINNDVTLQKNWLGTLIQYMSKNQEVGFAQGSSMLAHNNQLFDSTGIYLEKGFIPNQRANGKKDPSLEITSIGPNAAGAIYRASMLQDIVQGVDEYYDNRFFAYVEDVDLNLRCTLRGWKFGFVPEARLFHVGSATGNKIAKKKMFWGARNLVWLVYKNASGYVIKRTFKMIVRSHLANLQFLWREQRGNFWPYLKGLFYGIFTFLLFTTKRKKNLRSQKLSDEQFLNLLIPSNPPLTNPLRKLADLIK